MTSARSKIDAVLRALRGEASPTLEDTYRKLRTAAYDRQPWRLNTAELEKLSSLQQRALSYPSRIHRYLAQVSLAVQMQKFSPELLYAAVAVLYLRWRRVENELPPYPYFVLVHASPGGFQQGFWDGKVWRTPGSQAVLNVLEWRPLEGSGANPWHDPWPRR